MGRKESYSDRLRREGGMVASGKFREERREATCECCRRNDAPEGERICVSCTRHHDALIQERDEWERIAAERGTRMDEIQARAEAAEAALATTRQALAAYFAERDGWGEHGDCAPSDDTEALMRRALAATDTTQPA